MKLLFLGVLFGSRSASGNGSLNQEEGLFLQASEQKNESRHYGIRSCTNLSTM